MAQIWRHCSFCFYSINNTYTYFCCSSSLLPGFPTRVSCSWADAPLTLIPVFQQVMGPPLFKGEGGSLATHLRHLILVKRDVISLNKAIYVALGLLVHPSEQESSTTHTYLQFYSFTCRSFWYHLMRHEKEVTTDSLPMKTDSPGVKESLETLPHSKPFNLEKRKAAVRAQDRFFTPVLARFFMRARA